MKTNFSEYQRRGHNHKELDRKGLKRYGKQIPASKRVSNAEAVA